ncbi:MAG: transporter substrate-binding domain-containing protein, partial [Rubrivivax sp.]
QALGLAGERLVAVPDAQTGRAAVATGNVDALALSLPTLTWMARQQPGSFEVLPDTDSAGDRVAFAFGPDAAALQQAWNRAQAVWVGGAEHRRLVAELGFVIDAVQGPAAAASQ